MPREDDEINPFSRQATFNQANRDIEPEAKPATPPPPQRPRRRSFLVWLIPLLLVLVITPVLCCGGLLLFGFNKLNEPVDAAIVAMEVDDKIAAKLGTPLERTSGLAVTDYQYDNGEGSAVVEFQVDGPSGSAEVAGKMKLFAGVWSPEDLTITCSDGTEFKLPATKEAEPGEVF